MAFISYVMTSVGCTCRRSAFGVEFLQNGLSDDHKVHFTRLAVTISLINQPDRSLAASCRRHSATKHCTKVNKNGCCRQRQSRIIGHRLTPNHQILRGPLCRLQPHRVWCHQLFPVGIYRRSKMAENYASDGFNLESLKLAHTSTPTSWSVVPDMTPLITSGRLQDAIKYWTKVMHKTVSAGQRVKYFGHCLTQTLHMLRGHPCRRSLQPDRIWLHQLLGIGIYWSSKNGRKCRLRRLCLDF